MLGLYTILSEKNMCGRLYYAVPACECGRIDASRVCRIVTENSERGEKMEKNKNPETKKNSRPDWDAIRSDYITVNDLLK